MNQLEVLLQKQSGNKVNTGNTGYSSNTNQLQQLLGSNKGVIKVSQKAPAKTTVVKTQKANKGNVGKAISYADTLKKELQFGLKHLKSAVTAQAGVALNKYVESQLSQVDNDPYLKSVRVQKEKAKKT
jgi:nitrous oxide reductase